jgi:hypothetical protein
MPEFDATIDIFPTVLIVGSAIIILGIAATLVIFSLNSNEAREVARQTRARRPGPLPGPAIRDRPVAGLSTEQRLRHLDDLRAQRVISASEQATARADVLRSVTASGRGRPDAHHLHYPG